MAWAPPVELAQLLDFTREHVLAHPFGNGHPRVFAWGNPAPAAAVPIAG